MLYLGLACGLSSFSQLFWHILKAQLATKFYTSSRFPRFLLVTIVFLSLVTSSKSQLTVLENGGAMMKGIDTGIHPDSPTRQKIDLNGEWSYSLDGESWDPIRVPSAVDMEGSIQFRRTFTITDSLLSASAFKFVALGINHDAEIFVNETFIGRHVGGYTSFEFDIPDDALQVGNENAIRVVVHNELSGRFTLPVRQQVWGWKNYLGILRDVFILAVPRVWIDGLRIRTSLDPTGQQGSCMVEATLTAKQLRGHVPDSVTHRTVPASLLLELIDRSSGVAVSSPVSAPVVIEQNKNIPVSVSVLVPSPKRWTPELPDLYLVRASLVTAEGATRTVLDQTSVNVGFVAVSMVGNELVVNGRKTTLKGVVWHEDAPQTGAAVTYEQMERDIVAIKSLGANAIRFAFHPPHPYALNLCSRYGLFALVEIPIWNVPAEVLVDENFVALAEVRLRETIERDQAFPAVLAWGLGHSFDTSDELTAAVIRRLRDAARTLDDRPVYAGCVLADADRGTGEADIAAVILPTSDLKVFKRQLADWKIAHPRKPVWILGYGKPVDHRNRNGYNDPLSQEAQARFFLQYYGAIKDAGISGSFVDAFADWRGDRPLLTVPVEDRSLYPLGLVSATREKRASFEMVRVLYNEEKISALPAGTYRSSFPIAHVLAGLFVIILLGYQYGYNRRFGEGLKRALMRSYNFFADLRDLHAVSAAHTVILAFSISLTFAVLLSAILYHFRSDAMFDYVLTFFVASTVAKNAIIWVTWNPFGGIVVLTAVFFVAGAVLAMLLRLVGMILKARSTWFHVYSVSVWGATPVIFLSPVAMSLFKLLQTSVYVIPSLVVIAVFLGWTFLRVLKGMSVVFETNPLRTTIGGILLMLLLCGGVVLYYDAVYALGSYVSFVAHLMQAAG